MDPLSQATLGAVAAIAVAGHKLPRASALIGLAAGLAPDADVFINSTADPLVWIIYHRHFTHALAFIPIGALACAAPFLLRPAWRRHWPWVLAASLAAFATHGLLDAATSYGTLLLWPFSDARVAFDVLPIVDLVLTPVLLLGTLGAVLLRARWPALAAAGFFAAYCGLGVAQHHRAAAWQAQLADARGHAVDHARVLPAPGALVLWRSVYKTPDGALHADALRLPYLGQPQIILGASAPPARREHFPQGPAAERAWRIFHWFADGFVTAPPGRPGLLGDGRYTTDGAGFEPLWGLVLHDDGATVTRWSPPGGRQGWAARLWALLWGRDERLLPAADALSQARLAARAKRPAESP